jgi:hypothetical protein
MIVPALIVFAIIIFVYMIFRYIYGFWLRQPVFHAYDISYYFSPNRVISPNIPEKNRFTDFIHVKTNLMDEITEKQWALFVEFIQRNFLKQKNNEYSPKLENILPYFKNSTKSLFSFYFKDNITVDNPITNELLGVMTSRPIHSILSGNAIPLYYVDYLCVKKSHRKRGIAERIIQTHHYNQRRLNKNIQVSLFKRENELTGIVPVTCYDTLGYVFPSVAVLSSFSINAKYAIIECGKTNIHHLMDYIKEQQSRYSVFIYDTHSSLLETISTQNVKLYFTLDKETQRILAMYAFKNPCVTISGKQILTCYASIKTIETSDELFYYFFLDILKNLKLPKDFLVVENISDNNLLCDKLKQHTKPFIRSPTAYFLYNYILLPVNPKQCLILL